MLASTRTKSRCSDVEGFSRTRRFQKAALLAAARAGVAGAARLRGDHAAACRLAREALRAVDADDALGQCAALNTLAAALAAFADAETRANASHRDDARDVAKRKRAARDKAAAKYAEAVAHLRSCLARYADYGSRDVEARASACSTNLAAALEALGDDASLREALALAEAAVAARTRQSGADRCGNQPLVQTGLTNLETRPARSK